MNCLVKIVNLFDRDWEVGSGLLFCRIVLVDKGEVWSKIDVIFISVIFKVMPQSMVKDNRVRFLFLQGREDKKIVSLLVSCVGSKDPYDLGVSALS